MTLLEHLRELRSRLFKAVLGLVAGAAVGFWLFPTLLDLITGPFCDAQDVLNPGAGCDLVALRPLEPFSVRMKTSLVVGFFLGGPVIFYQLWRFITPGLTKRERRLSLPFVVLSQFMFAVGIAFSYLVIPNALRVLLGFAGPDIELLLSVQEYLSFFLTTAIAFGIIFEMPLILVFLSLVGVLTAKGMRRARPYAISGIFVVAAIITPTTDAVTLLLMAGPMTLFYEVSIIAAVIIERRRRKRAT
jgi:sec-independent protein translocase protein TatC